MREAHQHEDKRMEKYLSESREMIQSLLYTYLFDLKNKNTVVCDANAPDGDYALYDLALYDLVEGVINMIEVDALDSGETEYHPALGDEEKEMYRKSKNEMLDKFFKRRKAMEINTDEIEEMYPNWRRKFGTLAGAIKYHTKSQDIIIERLREARSN